MIKYKATSHKKWKWELAEDYKYEFNDVEDINYISTQYINLSMKLGFIKLKKSYAINGVNLLPDRKVWMRAAFVHDALWQLIQLGKLPKSMAKVADRIFRDIVAEDNNRFNAWLMWLGVRIGAKWRFGIRY